VSFPFGERSTDIYVQAYDHVAPRIVAFKRGGVFAMFEVEGSPAETIDMDRIFQQRTALNHSLTALSSNQGLVLYSWVCRGFAPESVYPEGVFRSTFAHDLNETYRAKLMDRFLYLNKTYVGVMLQPPRLAGEWVHKKTAWARRDRDITDESPVERIQRLMQVCDILQGSLAPYKPRRLGLETRHGVRFSEIGEALAFAMTGIWRPIGLQTGRRIGQLFNERIIVGKEIVEIRGPGDSTFAACFGAKDMMELCPPGAFDGFLKAQIRTTIHQSFRPLRKVPSLEVMGRQQNRMVSAGDRAFSQIKSLDVAMDEVQSGRMAMGDYHLVVTAFADDIKSMRRVANATFDLLQNTGMQVAREDKALEGAYFTMLPDNGDLRPRPGTISTWNYASMAGMHAYPAGAEKGKWGDPIMLLRTTGGTPLRVHLHVNGVANVFLYGESGSGKSSFLAFLVTQCERLGIQVVLWDKDRGLEIVTRGVGGRYLSIRNPTGVAPLKALTESPEDIHHLAQLIRGQICVRDAYVMTSEEDRRLIVGLRAIMALPPADRWMGDLRAFLGVSSGAGARLEKWCRHFDGEYAWVTDNDCDMVKLDAHVLGFDVTEFLDDPMVCGPIMTHLLYRTDKLADGRRILYIVDEGWKVVNIPAFADSALNNLKTDRKKNAGFIFGSQSIKDALNSPIAYTIREQCKTVIGFGVERPDRKDMEALNYTDRECEIIEGLGLNPGTGQFLLRQAGRSVVAQLALHGLDDELAVLSGNTVNVGILDGVREKHGDCEDRPERLIAEFHRARAGVIA
jgi:type IV secretion system protein VirB4